MMETEFLGKMTLVQVVTCRALHIFKFISFISVLLPHDDYVSHTSGTK